MTTIPDTTPAAPAQPTQTAATELPQGGAPADGVAVDGQTQPAVEQPSQPNPNRDVKHRFSALTAERNEALREAAYYRALADERGRLMETRLAPPPPPVPAAPQAPQRPNPAQYAAGEFDPAYQEAQARYLEDLTDYKARQIVENTLTERQKASEREARESERIQQFATVYRAAEERGLDGAVQVLASRAVSQDTKVMLSHAQSGPLLAEALARNPQTLQQLEYMDPQLRAIELGRLDSRIVTALEAQRAAAAAPPPPPNPPPSSTAPLQAVPALVNGRGVASASSAPPVGNQAAYEAWRKSRG